ncbi:MAG: RidA family protein [Erysipelotrichaceae bacterium]|nr:RidA family protein [Erysipelotrichaceae bacterium]
MKEKIESAKAPEAIGPYSQAIATDNLIFVSGQIPVNRETGTMPEGIKEQTRQSLNNIAYILDEAGADMSDVVKTTVLIQHMSDFAEMNEVYATFFTQDPPARACYEVAALPKGALVEIEAIAVKK